MGEWQPIETAPRDGTPILVVRDNGCGWEHLVAWWWGNGKKYPWTSDYNVHAEDRFDYWMPLPPAPKVNG